jgi:hypothetical protein
MESSLPTIEERRRIEVRISNAQLETRVKAIEEYMREAGLLEGEVLEEEAYESMRTPHLILQYGSPTYGNSWRIFATGGSVYRSAHYDPLHLTLGYLGSTRSEAWQTLTGIYITFSAISWKAQREAYALAEASK